MTEAPPGTVFVCAACGKTSPTREPQSGDAIGWDESCMLHAVLCHKEKSPTGSWVAVKRER